MNEHPRASWLVYTLGALCVVAVVAAFLVVGPPSQSATTQSRTVTVAEGVVQSTVSGSGNLQAITQLNLGFKTGGVVSHIYVTQGEHVTAGQLLATLNPQSAEVTLEQAKATLQAAEASLAQEEESGGETSSGSSSAKAGAAAFGGSGPTGATGTSGTTGATGATGQTGESGRGGLTGSSPSTTTQSSTTTTATTNTALRTPSTSTKTPAGTRTTTVTTRPAPWKKPNRARPRAMPTSPRRKRP